MLLSAVAAMGAPPAAQFQEHTIATDLKGGYQVMAVDLNRDGKLDLIALASGMKELVWYENPGWQRHVLAGGFTQLINVAPVQADASGIPKLVVAHGFSMEAKRSLGIVSLLECQGDPAQPWKVSEIDRLPTSHRLRAADIDGSGKKVVVNAPLSGAETGGPDYRGHTPLVFYRPGEWKRELIGEENEGVVHGLGVFDWDGDGRDEILTASFVGIHLYKLGPGGKWTRTELTKANPSPWPKCGASEIAVGHLGKRRFLCSIEPWHGNEVVVYFEREEHWQRQALDTGFVDGHTIQAAGLNGDGRDTIVAGYRGTGRSVYLYEAAGESGEKWTRRPLDEGGMAASSCVVADLNGDGRLDVACIGSATTNLKWYENLGPAQKPAPAR